jgi:S1-C subfamily serine protease
LRSWRHSRRPFSAQGRAGLLPDFTELYEKNGPAVVSIDVTQKARRARGMPGTLRG